MSRYFEELCRAMSRLAREPGAIFIGQAVEFEGTAMFRTLRDVPIDRRLEVPVFENTQLGMATGMALAGMLPICIFPRINFLLDAMSQLVQHLDKLPLFSDYRPRVIIRTAIATPNPLDPGPQHVGEYTDAIAVMLRTIKVVKLREADQIVPEYRAAAERDGSTLLVEYSAKYT